MIPALHAFGWEYQLVEPADLKGAVIGLSAEVLAGLSPAEIVARIGRTAPHRYVVVFDGPGRTTPARLDDGLVRRRVVRALVEAEVPFVVAPALAAAQLAYMHSQRRISHASGSDELWLWADVPLVLDIFASPPQMLRRSAVLAQLRLHQDSFVELVAGLGHTAVATEVFPPLDRSPPPPLDAAAAVAAQMGGAAPPPGPDEDRPAPAVSLYRAALALADPAYLASLQRTLTFIYRQPVLHLDGTIQLSNLIGKELPKDLTDVVGCQISPVLHYYINAGVLGPELVRGMVWGKYTDPMTAVVAKRELSEPLLAAQFRTLQQALSPVRQQAYALLVSTCHRYFQMREVVVRIPGAANFSKAVQPKLPQLSCSAGDATPQSVVSDAVRHLQAMTDMAGTSILDLAQEFAQKHSGEPSKLPTGVLVQSTALVFRQLVEVVVFWLLATQGVQVDLKKVVLLLPFH